MITLSHYPKITIITPSYNQGDFIEDAILSVLDQDYPNLEYIIYDNCSTDKTSFILKKYEDKISKIIIESDRGSANAINKGLSAANGEWINWLNADDVLMPNSLFTLAMVASANPSYSWISGGKVNLDKTGNYISSQMPWKENISFWLFGDALFPQDATFIRRNFLLENKILLDESLCNVYDTVLYLQLLSIERPLLTTAIFSGMRWHSDQKTADSAQRELENAVVEKHFNQMKNSSKNKIAKRLCSTRFAILFKVVFVLLARIKLWPSRLDWECYAYDVWSRDFEKKALFEFVLQ